MNIYVGNLSLEVTDEELRQEFIGFGEVISVTVMNDKYIGSGQSRGYGFVEMGSESKGNAAITSLNGKSLRGRVIDVMQALPSQIRGTSSFSIREGLVGLMEGAGKENTKSSEISQHTTSYWR